MLLITADSVATVLCLANSFPLNHAGPACYDPYTLPLLTTFFPFHPIFLCADASPHFFFLLLFFVVVGFLAFGIHGNVMTYSLTVCLPFACVPSSNLVVNKDVQSDYSAHVYKLCLFEQPTHLPFMEQAAR